MTVSMLAAVAAYGTWPASTPAVEPCRVVPRPDRPAYPARCALLPASPGRHDRSPSQHRSIPVSEAATISVVSRSCISMPRISSNRPRRSLIGAQRQRDSCVMQHSRAGPMPSARSRSVVGHRQAPLPVCAQAARCRRSTHVLRARRWCDATALRCRPAVAWGASRTPSATARSRRAARQVHVQGQSREPLPPPSSCSRGTARTLWIAAPMRVVRPA